MTAVANNDTGELFDWNISTTSSQEYDASTAQRLMLT